MGEPDIEKGAAWFARAAEAGDVTAQYFLGASYFGGAYGLAVDYEKAFKFSLLAAEAGHEAAREQVGISYVADFGVESDHEAGYMWLYMAPESANRTHFLAVLESILDTETIERAKARASEKLAAFRVDSSR